MAIPRKQEAGVDVLRADREDHQGNLRIHHLHLSSAGLRSTSNPWSNVCAGEKTGRIPTNLTELTCEGKCPSPQLCALKGDLRIGAGAAS